MAVLVQLGVFLTFWVWRLPVDPTAEPMDSASHQPAKHPHLEPSPPPEPRAPRELADINQRLVPPALLEAMPQGTSARAEAGGSQEESSRGSRRPLGGDATARGSQEPTLAPARPEVE